MPTTIWTSSRMMLVPRMRDRPPLKRERGRRMGRMWRWVELRPKKRPKTGTWKWVAKGQRRTERTWTWISRPQLLSQTQQLQTTPWTRLRIPAMLLPQRRVHRSLSHSQWQRVWRAYKPLLPYSSTRRQRQRPLLSPPSTEAIGHPTRCRGYSRPLHRNLHLLLQLRDRFRSVSLGSRAFRLA